MYGMAEKSSNVTSATAPENLYMQLNASELSAIIMKGSPHSNDRDAGFCSGSSEGGDDLSMDLSSRLDPSSPTDASEDSVEVKVMPIALLRNKRKSSEPSKVICEREVSTAPLKKRIRYTSSADSAVVAVTPPVAHASHSPSVTTMRAAPWERLPHELMPNPAQVFVRHPGVTTLHRLPLAFMEDVQQEPLALVVRKKAPALPTPTTSSSTNGSTSSCTSIGQNSGTTSNSHHASVTPLKSTVISPSPQQSCSPPIKLETDNASLLPPPPRPQPAPSVASSHEDERFASLQNTSSGSSSGTRPHQRNYKNMTRERRIEANARERTRVHTISAAYESLRKAVPSYSDAQKLSKLSVLRVACSYILTLSRMVGEDYSEDQSKPSIASCFEAVTATIQTEGKLRKKKDE